MLLLPMNKLNELKRGRGISSKSLFNENFTHCRLFLAAFWNANISGIPEDLKKNCPIFISSPKVPKYYIKVIFKKFKRSTANHVWSYTIPQTNNDSNCLSQRNCKEFAECYSFFWRLQTLNKSSKSSPIGEKSPNLVTLDPTKLYLV